jgi:hypothetical protein
LVLFDGVPIHVRDNMVMCRLDDTGADYHDSANKSLLARALREKLGTAATTNKTDDEVITSVRSRIGFVPSLSRWDNRDHGFKPIAGVRIRGASNVLVSGLTISTMAVVAERAFQECQAWAVDLSDCNDVLVKDVAIGSISAPVSIGVRKQRCCGIRTDNIGHPNTSGLPLSFTGVVDA